MSMAANIVLLASKGDADPDWAVDAKYLSSPVEPMDTAVGVTADSSGNVVVSSKGSPGFGVQCYNKFSNLHQLRFNNGISVSGGGVNSPEGEFVPNPNSTTRIVYNPTFDDPGNVNTWTVFNVFDVNTATGELTTFAYGIDTGSSSNESSYTQITSSGSDSSNSFYGCGMTKQSGSNEFPHLLKYNSAAALQWSLVVQPQTGKYTGAGVSTANFGTLPHMVSDTSGNTYVSLKHTTDAGSPEVFSYKLMKFNSSGAQQWVRVVSGPQSSGISATDGTYLYSADAPTSSTLRVVATNVSDGTIAWEKTLTFSGNTPAVKQIIISGGYVYILSQTSNEVANTTNNTGMTWIKMSTAGAVEWNRHIHASGDTYATEFFGSAYNGAISGSKMYTIFEGLGGITTVKLPLDGSKTGVVGKLPFISFGGAEPFSYNSYVSDINVNALSISASTTSTATSSSSTYATTTTSITTTDVDVLSLGVTYNEAQIKNILAPLNIYNPVVTYSKRLLT